jgi:LDH2 family malate/lactate/ureidoglycolate dehydrogenase
VRQASWITEACLNSTPIDPESPVRMPGQQGIKNRQYQMSHGVTLHPSIMPALITWSQEKGVDMPSPIK